MAVHDVAAYILERRGPMSAMKLQKLVYYSQAWTLALTGAPLFDEQIQAWAHGPVVYELFDRHRGQFVLEAWGTGDPRRLRPTELHVIDAVLDRYARMSAEALSKLTHEELPWREARAGLRESQRSAAVISHESMRRFYSTMMPPIAT